MSHGSSTNVNALIQRLCSDVGTLWLSSGSCTLNSTNYTGTTQVSGGGSSSISTGVSFYNTGTMATVKDTTDYKGGQWPNPNINYTTDTNISVSCSVSGGTITFTVTLDEVPNGATVDSGTTTTLTSRPPSTTYLSDSWGSPTLSSSVSVA
jgi:hypothetical protein